MSENKKDLKNMELSELIKSINAFTALTRERNLTADETYERQLFREEYIQRIRRNLTTTLDNTDFEFADEAEDGCNS